MKFIQNLLLVVTLALSAQAFQTNDIWSKLLGGEVQDKFHDVIKDVHLNDVADKMKDVIADVRDVAEGGNPAKGCCFPSAWQGRAAIHTDVGSRGGMMSVGMFVPLIATDAKKQMWVMDEKIRMGHKGFLNITNYIDLKAMMLYSVEKSKKICRKMKLPKGANTGKCIDKKARYLGPATLGAGRGALVVDAYLVHKESKQDRYELEAVTTVQRAGCVPVSKMVTGQAKGRKIMSLVSFVDIKTKISNPKIFNIPDFCKRAEEMDISDLTGDAQGLMDHVTL